MIPKYLWLWKVVLTGLLIVAIHSRSCASHIFGGDFSMTPLSSPGYFLLSLNLYADGNTINNDHLDNLAPEVFIFSKKDFSKKSSITLKPISNNTLVYSNKRCAEINNFKTIELKYSLEIYLKPELYSDPEGYYVIYERCCRTNNISNLANQGQGVGMTYRLDFPAPYVNGKFVKNGSPDFGFPNGKLVCINQPFQMSMSASDTDGDDLRYSLVTPLQGYSTASMLYGDGGSHATYPEVRWAAGFSANNAISGNPTLQIDPQSGLLTVTANRLGIYVFTILVEEYRKGTKIGSVRRDFQLNVIDCKNTPPPTPIVEASSNPNQPATIVPLCEGSTVDLSFANLTPDVNYQWEKNNEAISNATSNKITVSQFGEYRVRASYSLVCSPDTASKVIKVVAGKTPPNTITAKDSLPFCKGDSTLLRATFSTDYQYEWKKNGNILPNSNRSTITVRDQGEYIVTIKSPNFSCPNIDSLNVTVRDPLTKPELQTTKQLLCEQDSIQLRTSLPFGTSAQWIRNGQILPTDIPEIYIKQEGVYRVRVFEGKCAALSDSVTIRQGSATFITFDSLKTVCYSDTGRVILNASPPGGNFLGDGITGNMVSIKTVGVGRHAIRYELSQAAGCGLEKTRYLEVKASPTLRAPSQLTQDSGGETILLVQSASPIGEKYQWTPPDGVSNPNTLQPSVSAPKTTLYTLKATSIDGCVSSISINVLVVDLLFVPDVFSPNGDGINDAWEIKNLPLFPNAEIYIYNRWGEVVHHQSKEHSTPWNGYYLDKPAPVGEYSYVIIPDSNSQVNIQRGKLVLIR